MGDLEKAKREARYAKMNADERRWDQLEPRLKTIEVALEGLTDAEKAPVLAELAPMRAAMTKGVREERSGQIERELKRNLSAATDEFARGQKESSQLQRSIVRIASAEAQEWLLPEVLARLQAEIAALQAKSGGAAVPPPPTPTATAAAPPATVPIPAAAKSAPPAAAPVTATPPPSASSAASAPGGDPERSRAIESDITRTLKFGIDELANAPDRAGPLVERAQTRLDSDEAKAHLAPETIQRLRAQAADLLAKIEAAKRAGRIARIEEQFNRHLRNSERDLERDLRSAGDMVRHAADRLEMDDAKSFLPAETALKFRGEIARVRALLAGAAKKAALASAEPMLRELEERVARPIFDGSEPEYKTVGGLESLKSRVRGALSELPAGDAEVEAIEGRLASVDARISEATVALGREQAHGLVARHYELEQQAIAGWSEESGSGYELPRTALAVRRLTWFLEDRDIVRLRSEFKDDAGIQAVLGEAEGSLESATAKLQAAFDAAMTVLEKGKRPANRIDLELPSRLAGQAGSEFAGTAHADGNVARAQALGERWRAEIAADRAAQEAVYQAQSAVALAAWPAILAAIKAEDVFDPLDGGAKGRTVRLQVVRNRIGWDFTGAYDFAIWVGGTPVVGNYAENVAAAVNAACEKTGLGLDDHTDWDAVIKVGGPGKVRQRFRVAVRDRSNREIGSIEDWQPVDCVMCTVIALRAGPAAVGPR
jgi:ribosomal protein S11